MSYTSGILCTSEALGEAIIITGMGRKRKSSLFPSLFLGGQETSCSTGGPGGKAAQPQIVDTYLDRMRIKPF